MPKQLLPLMDNWCSLPNTNRENPQMKFDHLFSKKIHQIFVYEMGYTKDKKNQSY